MRSLIYEYVDDAGPEILYDGTRLPHLQDLNDDIWDRPLGITHFICPAVLFTVITPERPLINQHASAGFNVSNIPSTADIFLNGFFLLHNIQYARILSIKLIIVDLLAETFSTDRVFAEVDGVTVKFNTPIKIGNNMDIQIDVSMECVDLLGNEQFWHQFEFPPRFKDPVVVKPLRRPYIINNLGRLDKDRDTCRTSLFSGLWFSVGPVLEQDVRHIPGVRHVQGSRSMRTVHFENEADPEDMQPRYQWTNRR